MKKVTDCTPVGYAVLVELLSKQEAMGTRIHVSEESKGVGAPQGYILKLGPFVKEEKDYNFNVGDRVLLAGNFTPVPECPSESGRACALVEPHTIKAVLGEEEVSDSGIVLADTMPE